VAIKVHLPNDIKMTAESISARNLGSLLWFQVTIVAALILVLYGHVLADLANDWWTDPSLSQGLLIPPLALYIAWTRRDLTLAQPAGADNRGLWLIACACLFYILGKLGAEFFLPRLSFVILLAGLTWTFWGYGRLSTLAFPLLLLATMVPLPALVYNSIAAPLQLFASDVATNLAQLLGVAVYRDGNVIHLAHISLGVEEACSGLNSLSALMVASLLLGFLVCQRIGIRVLLFALSIPLSIAVNVLRVTGTAVIADYREEFAMGFYHSFSGWLVFIGGFAILYGIAKGLDRLTRATDRRIA
jgi:exosortase